MRCLPHIKLQGVRNRREELYHVVPDGLGAVVAIFAIDGIVPRRLVKCADLWVGVAVDHPNIARTRRRTSHQGTVPGRRVTFGDQEPRLHHKRNRTAMPRNTKLFGTAPPEIGRRPTASSFRHLLGRKKHTLNASHTHGLAPSQYRLPWP